MSVEEYAKSLLSEVTGKTGKQPPAGVDDGSLADEAKKRSAPTKKPEPNKPDPEEVQYPGYFKDGAASRAPR
jgi:hypothetical protein